MGRNPFDKLSQPSTENDEQIAPPPGLDTPEGEADAIETSTPPERSHIEGIPTADWQPKPRKQDTRKREKTRKVSLLPEIQQRLRKHTNALNVPEYELVRYLLEYGLEQIAAGHLVFEAQLADGGLTLYPNQKRRKTRSRKPEMVNTAYRGIPDETWDQIKNLTTAYPIWQIINKLLEYGFEQMESGALRPQPQHNGVGTLFA
jgi:hypothetical protein